MLRKLLVKYVEFFDSFLNSERGLEDPIDLSYWRNYLFLRFLSIIFPLGLLVVIPSMILSLHVGMIFLGIIDLFAFLVIAFISITRSFSIKTKKTIFTSVMYLLAATLIYTLGIQGPGYIYLLCLSVASTVIISSLTGFISVAINAAILLVYNIFAYYGWFPSVIKIEGSLAPNLVIGLNFLFVNGLLIVLINQILSGLDKTLKKDRYLRKKAQESDALKSAFLANISHEIRTPLNAIMGFSGLGMDEDVETDQVNTYLKYINTAGEDLLEIIDNLISISIIQTGQIKLYHSEVVLADLIEDCYQIASTLPKSSSVQIVKHFDRNISCITDKAQLKQALTNLILNALKFTKTGKVEIGYIGLKDQIRFHVKDTGTGIPDYAKADLFKQFYKISNSKEIKAGTGLGLAITKGIVESLGGKIWFDSKLDVGTTFYFTIPVEPIGN